MSVKNAGFKKGDVFSLPGFGAGVGIALSKKEAVILTNREGKTPLASRGPIPKGAAPFNTNETVAISFCAITAINAVRLSLGQERWLL